MPLINDGQAHIWNGAERTWIPADVGFSGGVVTDVRYASLAAAISAIGSAITTLRITTPNFSDGNANNAVPSTLTLEFTGVGSLSLTTGKTTTINSDNSNWPRRQIFVNALSGQGTVVLQERAYPEWWINNTTPGTTDMAAAVNAADASVCSGALAPDGVSTAAQGRVIFANTTYRLNSTVTYRGAPWIGDGINNTLLDFRGSTYAIDALGTSVARKRLSLSDFTLTGGNASAGTKALKLGWNHRSYAACRRVQIDHFPADGVYFADSTADMIFYDLAVINNATASGAGINIDAAVSFVNQIDFVGLQLENNGQVSSGLGGGIDINVAGVAEKWNFFGGLWQGNKGDAEARFNNGVAITVDGVHIESGLAASGAVNGVIFAGQSTGIVIVPKCNADATHGGAAIVAKNTSIISIADPVIHSNWPTFFDLHDTATVRL